MQGAVSLAYDAAVASMTAAVCVQHTKPGWVHPSMVYGSHVMTCDHMQHGQMHTALLTSVRQQTTVTMHTILECTLEAKITKLQQHAGLFRVLQHGWKHKVQLGRVG